MIPLCVWVVPQLSVTNLPYHPATEVRHVVLRKRKRLLSPGQGLEELAREHAAVVAVLLLRGVLQT